MRRGRSCRSTGCTRRVVVAGNRMKEIGAILQLSTRTVETHKYELMNVLGVHSTAELVRYAIRHGLVDQ